MWERKAQFPPKQRQACWSTCFIAWKFYIYAKLLVNSLLGFMCLFSPFVWKNQKLKIARTALYDAGTEEHTLGSSHATRHLSHRQLRAGPTQVNSAYMFYQRPLRISRTWCSPSYSIPPSDRNEATLVHVLRSAWRLLCI